MNEREQRRESVIERAVTDGRLVPEARDRYRAAWDADPFGTEQVLASLSPGLTPEVRAALTRAQDPNPELAGARAWFPELSPTPRLKDGSAAVTSAADVQGASSVSAGSSSSASAPAAPAAQSPTPEDVASWSESLFPAEHERTRVNASGPIQRADDA
jgi:hypothetical protein